MKSKTDFVRFLWYGLFFIFLLFSPHFLTAQNLTIPEEFIGHKVGADYCLADWDTIVRYFFYVSENSDRVNVRQIATTTEGRPYLIAEISSPDAIRNRAGHM